MTGQKEKVNFWGKNIQIFGGREILIGKYEFEGQANRAGKQKWGRWWKVKTGTTWKTKLVGGKIPKKAERNVEEEKFFFPGGGGFKLLHNENVN